MIKTYFNPITKTYIQCDENEMKRRLDIVNSIFLKNGRISLGEYLNVIHCDDLEIRCFPLDEFCGFALDKTFGSAYPMFTFEEFLNVNVLLFPRQLKT